MPPARKKGGAGGGGASQQLPSYESMGEWVDDVVLCGFRPERGVEKVR